ncbi:MAG: AAA family ATPase, partial [Xanthomonadales bacterium]|nr:AAA family ATPase [Xanthomonadales bacterium]
MIKRALQAQLRSALERSPAVVLLGPRQVGKTTLALQASAEASTLYLDLESERDRARLSDPERYLPSVQDRLVILDEVHRLPGLFPILR